MSFNSGRGTFGQHGKYPSQKAERIGWRVPFSEQPKRGVTFSHYLVGASDFYTREHFAYRLCMGGHLVNRALVSAESAQRSKRCACCLRSLAAMGKNPAS